MGNQSATTQWLRGLPRSLKPGKMGTMDHRGNISHNWDEFDPNAYSDHNYRALRDDDRQIIERLRDFLVSCALLLQDAHGVDVGAGSNLYPALGMLPFCKKIDLLEYSRPNVRWLKRKRFTLWLRLDRQWDPFWETYQQHPTFRERAGKRRPYFSLLRKVRVRQASVFDLPSRRYDVGTMFFVACSLSAEIADFYAAVKSFGNCLKPGAPFAIAFMTNSDGYQVADRRFPAVPIGRDEIARSLEEIDPEAKIEDIDTIDRLRPDVGMVLVTGTKLSDWQGARR